MSHLKKSYNHSQIVGIQFSILSPEEIRKSSVVEITSKDTYVNNKPVIKGLFDPRMGVLDRGFICPTDGLKYMDTPGYAGHIELARPVFWPQFVGTVYKILKCVCPSCSRLLICKRKHKQALNLIPVERWDYVFNAANKVKKCGDETENGCGCVKYALTRESGIANIYATWKTGEEEVPIKLTAEMVLKILKRISDEDVEFMGFSPIFSRPDWMICQVLSVSPPCVRPSVKQDSQQRSDDDLTHILVNIVKTNMMLQEKIKTNAEEEVVNNMSELVLQYFIATQIDNKIPGVCSIAQRSGRPYKSIKDRLNGKSGRMRGNLLGKRVDFSARCVITADSNISIGELGVPLKIAMNITRPAIVTNKNREFLKALILNGPENWPGAKTLQRKNGENITLKYFENRETIEIEPGDIIHRHMMDGDYVLFNRQPSLHRPSAMGHKAKIMMKGKTFRLNVAVTKPYNADFDGDEMNLHMPQDTVSETELRLLAPARNHIISPAKNAPIIGIFQDSMLGSYLFTQDNMNFTPRQAMNLLAGFKYVDENKLLLAKNTKTGLISSYDILSQIFPPLSLKRIPDDVRKLGSDAIKTSKKVVEIKNGVYLRGELVKSVLGEGTNGILHRINNDFGSDAVSDFIDNLQSIITKFMIMHSYSCGISDLISNKKTKDEITDVINKKKDDVQNLIEQVLLGVFENNTGKSNKDEFETQVNNILNQASTNSGKIGVKSLESNNRFVGMVKAGSKGDELNIAFMISCLGQQNVDGKRIPYGFDQRTLPHYCRYDDSPAARGFVENSYIKGLTPQQLFFHAMAGREGLIDTAVKTSATGYIQRRIVKGLEDLVVKYDMTIRNNKNKIVQFHFGDDNFDSMSIENQIVPFLEMKMHAIYEHYVVSSDKNISEIMNSIFPKDIMRKMDSKTDEYNKRITELVSQTVEAKTNIIKHIFHYKDEKKIHIPVSFVHIIENIRQQLHITNYSSVDINLYDAMMLIDEYYNKLLLIHYCKPNKLFTSMFYYYLSPKYLLIEKRFNHRGLILLLEAIIYHYKKALVAPGEMVGILAGQSIGEVSTQMTLNTFHFAGVASKSNVTRGVPRLSEILSLSRDIKNSSLSVYLKEDDETLKENAMKIMYMLELTKLQDIVKNIQICFDPKDQNTLIAEDRDLMKQYNEFHQMFKDVSPYNDDAERTQCKWIIRIELDRDIMLDKNVTMDDINLTIQKIYGKEQISCVYTDFNSNKLIFRIRLSDINKKTYKALANNVIDQSDQIYLLKGFQDQLLNNVIIRGVKGIKKVIMRRIKDMLYEENGGYSKKDIWILDTIGTNLMDVLGLPFIDNKRTLSNDIMEVYDVLGIEAARETIYNELVDVIQFDGTYINYHNYSVLVDRMTHTYKLISICRHGVNNDDIGPIAKASFEETPEMFLKAARHGELDNMRGVSANVMCGQEGHFGTTAFQVLVDTNALLNKQPQSDYVRNTSDDSDDIDQYFAKNITEKPLSKHCTIEKLTIPTNIEHIKESGITVDSDYSISF